MITPELMEKVIEQICKRYANYDYFFDKLKTPEWIPHLADRGLFNYPPNAIRQDGYISFPFWPQSKYLKRMAALNSSLVHETILKIPLNDNIRIHLDFLEAAVAMPIDDGFPIIKRELAWLRTQQYIYFLLPEKIGDTIIYLSKNGRDRTAIDLAAEVLAISENQDGKTEISLKMEKYAYESIIKKTMPELALVNFEETFNLLCALLKRAVEIKMISGQDYSCFWQSAIEDHPQNFVSDLRNYLVIAIRQLIEINATTPEKVEFIVNLLRANNSSIFERIALHTLRIAFSLNKELALKSMLDDKLFSEILVCHEYSLLLKERFKELSHDDQQVILGWIKKGSRDNDGGLSADQINVWTRDKLSFIEDSLPAEWKAVYDELVDKYGPARHPDFPVYSESSFGESSPLELSTVLSMSVSELVHYLASWNPEKGWNKPTRIGLASVLVTAVKENPERFAKEAEIFSTVDPTYVNELLSGLNQALEAEKVFEWLPVLNLCKWIVNAPIEIHDRISEYGNVDNGWKWTRKNIISLIRKGFDNKGAGIPFCYRELCWDILIKLASDCNPTPEEEAEESNLQLEPLNFAINTIRGDALMATIDYSIWAKIHLGDGKETAVFNIDMVPEARSVLEQHLDLQVDQSLAIRSIYGYYFQRLVFLDENWARDIVKKIFSPEPEVGKYRWAAWQTYVLYSGSLHSVVFEILQKEYAWSVQNLYGSSTENKKDDTVKKHIINHLMTLYGWGKISVGSSDKLINSFFEVAPDEMRAYFIEAIWEWLHGKDDEIPAELLENFQNLWEWRKKYQSNNIEECREEITAYGWLFATGKFDTEWSLAELMRAIKIANTVEPAWMVIEQLDLNDKIPSDRAIEMLDLLVRNGFKDKWTIYHVEDHMKSIIDKAIAGTPNVSDKAKALRDFLVAKGYRSFVG